MVYVNFEETPALQNLFLTDFDITRIVTTISIFTNTSIDAKDTLLVFDEIQSAEKGLTSLKYFCENAPKYYLIAAGSLLGMGLHSNLSFPVGKVNFLDLRPMSFSEFLSALGEESLAGAITKQDWGILPIFHAKLNEYLRYYFFTGGMPEVVKNFAETRNWELVRQTQNQILHSYEGDFSKHAPVEISRYMSPTASISGI
jgi:predicted AAA+ superfamily ATPase